VNPTSITAGQSATLTWQTANATSVSIDSIGTVQPSGTMTVHPSQSTTYHLVATGAGGTQDASTSLTVNAAADITAVNHILIMFQENRSFDSYFGAMTDYRTRNNIPINSSDGKIRDLSDPAAQVAAAKNISPLTGQAILPTHFGSVCTEDLTPDWGETHKEMNLHDSAAAGPDSPMDGFVNVAQGLSQFYGVLADKDGHRAMGFFDDHDLNFYYFMASNFAMGDMFFSPAPTRTTANRLFIHAATSQGHVHADEDVGGLTAKTIWRALDEKGVTWKIYVSDWNTNKFTFFNDFIDSGDPKRRANIVSIDQYFADLQAGTLPQVAFVETGMFSGRDEHPSNNPGQGIVAPPIDVQVGAAWVQQVIQALMTSSSWKDSAFFFAFDEGGGAFDHVPPVKVPNPDGIKPTDLFAGDPPGDFTITGFRIPNFIVSPFAKKNYVSHTPMDYTAILKFIETRFGMKPLNARDASMPDMTEFFDFTNGGPWATPPSPPVQNKTGVCDYTKQ
jgi:phospholipase C